MALPIGFPYQPEDVIPFGMVPQQPAFDIGPPMGMADLEAPQEPTPQDFWARVAQGAGPQPFGPMNIGNKPTGLEVLLALASGFANAKAGQGARRVSETDQRNQRAREAAKTLATWRHQERVAKQRAAENRELSGIRAANAPPQRPFESTYERTTGRIKAYKEAGLPVPGTAPRTPAGGKPSTMSERKVLGFYDMAKHAHDFATKPDAVGKSIEQRMIERAIPDQWRMHLAPNLIKDPEMRQLVQAQREFTEARLRPVSGATIRPDEYALDARTFWGQTGDDPETVRRKVESRNTIVSGLRFQAGKAYQEKYGGDNIEPGGDQVFIWDGEKLVPE